MNTKIRIIIALILTLLTLSVGLYKGYKKMEIVVNRCPLCDSKAELGNEAIIKHVYIEISVSAFCPECGNSWNIIYTPDRIEEK